MSADTDNRESLGGPLALAGGPSAAQRRAAMIRVNHAGEHGAVRIYEGQLAVLGRLTTTGETAETIRTMFDQEKRHLETFDRLVVEHGVRPTALRPLWDVAGFALGAATALMGEKAAMTCTAAVEEVIDAHYANQARALADTDPALHAVVEDFRRDEIEHRERARAAGGESSPAQRLLGAVIKIGCRAAIKLSEKL